MMSALQIARVLKYCENVLEGHEAKGMSGDEGPEYFEYVRNKGWVEALRLVLERNGPAKIRNTKMEVDDD